MRSIISIALLTLASSAFAADLQIARVVEDAKVIDRVAEASRRDLPRELLERIVTEDIDLLRGKRLDGTYQFATFERLEAGRETNSASIQPRKDDRLETIEMRGEFAYRLVLESPARRLLVTRNKPLWIDHVDVEYIPIGSSDTKRTSFPLQTWMEPGASKAVDLPEVARQATVRIFARANPEAGYGNVSAALLRAKIVDNADSPYADAVKSAKAILRDVHGGEISSIRSGAARIQAELTAREAQSTISVESTREVPVTPSRASLEAPSTFELYLDLQSIEDLMTGTDNERREGLDKLHQTVRKLRPTTGRSQ